jgi:hypothetical protein
VITEEFSAVLPVSVVTDTAMNIAYRVIVLIAVLAIYPTIRIFEAEVPPAILEPVMEDEVGKAEDDPDYSDDEERDVQP